MRNYTGSKRVRNAFDDIDVLGRGGKRLAHKIERNELKRDTDRAVEEYFEEQIVELEELSAMFDELNGWDYEARMRNTRIADPLSRIRAANRWADDEEDVGQSHYYEDGRWIELEEDDPYDDLSHFGYDFGCRGFEDLY